MDHDSLDAPSLSPDVTAWLQQLSSEHPVTDTRMFELLYNDIKRIARSHMRQEAAGHTLSATGLAHEAWFRMNEQSRTDWKNRSHFLATASTMMRRILVNHALASRAAKRDVAMVTLTTGGMEQISGSPGADVVAVHDALLELESLDPRAAQVVELRFFGGLENEEIAEVMNISPATVKRDWTVARAWLHRALSGG